MPVAELTRANVVDFALEQSGAYQSRHTILNNGRHIDDVIAPESLIEYPWAGYGIVQELLTSPTGISWSQDEHQYVIPAPGQAVRFLNGWGLHHKTINPNGLDVRDFSFDEEQIRRIYLATRLAIFDTVVMTGNTVATIAREIKRIRQVNHRSTVPIKLVAIVQCGTANPSLNRLFSRQEYLLRKSVSSSGANECMNMACVGAGF